MAVLKDLRVGQTWTQRTFSPIRPPNGPMETLQAIVVGQDWVEWDHRNVSTLLVEYRADSGTGFTSNGPPRGRMWVLKDGRIIQQEVTMLSSKMRFVRLTAAETEPYIEKLDEDWFVSLQLPAEELKANEAAP
jgi:hypothetical protein